MSKSLTARQIADLVIASALATLRQLPGVDPEQIEHAARAIGNNAAMAISLELDDES